MRTVVLNNNNVLKNGQNNTLVYNFPTTASFDKSYVAVASVSMYYAWFNIAAQYGNNVLSYTWTVGSTSTTYYVGGTTFPSTAVAYIPDGLYEVATLNQLLQYTMIGNGHYLINSATSQNVYFLEIVVNDARYRVQVNTFNVPVSLASLLPSVYTTPTAFPGFPTAVTSPAVYIPYDGIGKILGFDVSSPVPYIPSVIGGTPLAAGSSTLSPSTPNIQPNSSVLLSIDKVDNPYASPTSVVYSVTPSVAVGTIIADKPPQLLWNKLIKGQYSQLRVTLLGTDLSPLSIQDGAMTIILAIAEETEAIGVFIPK
jgi:hypothetical protein